MLRARSRVVSLALLLPLLAGCPLQDPGPTDVQRSDAALEGSAPSEAGAREGGTGEGGTAPPTCSSLGRECVTEGVVSGLVFLEYDGGGAPVVAYFASGTLVTVRWSGSAWERLALPAAIAQSSAANNTPSLHRAGGSLYLVVGAGLEVKVLRLQGNSWQDAPGTPLRSTADPQGLSFLEYASAASRERLYVATGATLDGSSQAPAVRVFDGSSWTLLTEATGLPLSTFTSSYLCPRADGSALGYLWNQHNYQAWSGDPSNPQWTADPRTTDFAGSSGCVDDGTRVLSVQAPSQGPMQLLQRVAMGFAPLGPPLGNAAESPTFAGLLLDASNAPLVGVRSLSGTPERVQFTFYRFANMAWQRVASAPESESQDAGALSDSAAARNGNNLGFLWAQRSTSGLTYLRFVELPL